MNLSQEYVSKLLYQQSKMVYHNPGSASPTPMSAPPNRNFITLIINEMSSSLLTSLFLKKQKLEIVKSFQDVAIIDKVSPGGSEWQKPPGNRQIQKWKTTNSKLN